MFEKLQRATISFAWLCACLSVHPSIHPSTGIIRLPMDGFQEIGYPSVF